MRKLRGTAQWWSSRWARAGVLVLLTAMVGAVMSAVTWAGAQAAAGGIRAGLGHRVRGGDFVGYYLAGGQKVYCLSPTKAVPRTVSLSTVSRYPGVSATASRQLAYALSRWGNARTTNAAAIESQVLNTLVGNKKDVHRRARSLSASVGRSVAEHVALARRLSGPYVVRVSTPKAVLPGQSAVGSVQVHSSSSGHAVAGVTVRLTHSADVSVPTRVRTDAHGTARLPYAVTDVGQVRIVATVSGLPSAALRVSHPGASQQRMVSWAGQVSARASSSFRAGVSGFSNRYACTTACDGHPVTTLTACAPASRYASRFVYRLGAMPLIVTFPASSRRVCKAVTARPGDGTRVSGAWQYLTRHGWSAPVAAAGTFVVDCPAVPPVAVTMSYDCTRAGLMIGIGSVRADGGWVPLVNASAHRYVLVVGGSSRVRVVAGRGRTAVFRAAVACGSHARYTMQAGVQRTNGTYNYGQVATVAAP